jgi:cell division protein FtsB
MAFAGSAHPRPRRHPAPAHADHRTARERAAARHARDARRSAPRRGIRWDRVGRIALLVVLVGIVMLYAGPARSYVSTLQEARQRSAEVGRLQRENRRLRARRAELQHPAALAREARAMGMVKPGERPYVIENLPGGP